VPGVHQGLHGGRVSRKHLLPEIISRSPAELHHLHQL
jgi:hypothetical protein